MKKILFAVMAICAIYSCSSTPAEETAPINGQMVTITFGGDVSTRAFFDESVTPEPWESEIKTLTIYCYDQKGILLASRSLSASELAARKVSFPLPNSAGGQNCSFYAVANGDARNYYTTQILESELETESPSGYNGTFDQVTTGSVRTGGFRMTGRSEAFIAERSITPVSIILKRVVAKIALRAKISEDFHDRFNGTVVLSTATIENAASVCYLFPRDSYSSHSNPLFNHTQSVGELNGYGSLFYVYESGVPASGKEAVTITLQGVFKRDNGETKDVTYTIPVNGNGNGKILRNGYYRLDTTIKGTGGSDIDLSITIADWEAPVTEEIDLGI